jgi:hypothetical protein
MKTYIEHSETITLDGLHIPKDLTNKDYRYFLKELEIGEAELIPHVQMPPTWEEIREQRNKRLQETDWINMADVKKVVNKNDWVNYRQQLRDLPQTYTEPENVVWPEKPL